MIARSYGKTRLDFYKERSKHLLAMDVSFRNSINNKSKSSVRYHILASSSYYQFWDLNIIMNVLWYPWNWEDWRQKEKMAVEYEVVRQHHQLSGHQSVSSVSQSCPTLCDPMKCSTPGLPVHHQLPGPTQSHVHWVNDAIHPSHPLSSPYPPALDLSQHQGVFKWVSSSHQVTKELEFQLQQSFQWTPRTDLL